MRRLPVFVLISFALLLVYPNAEAQIGGKKRGDPRVREILTKADLNFELDSDGDFKIGNKFDNGRTQLAFIDSDVSKLFGLEIRDVWSLALISDSPLSADIANNLLRENGRVKLGAWQVKKVKDIYIVVFAAKISADADRDTLLTTLQVVTQAADEKEKELSNNDEL
ncbi:MAG: hypothetical protein ACKV2Q_01175 [Planctomycetaceae bacterium]